MDKILIVKTSAIGDVLQTFPVLDYLRKRFPKAQIDWVVEAPIAPLLQAHPQLNSTIRIDTKTWKRSPFSPSTWRSIQAFIKELRSIEYDLLIDVQGNIKSAFVTGFARAKVKLGFDRKEVREWGNLLATNHTLALGSHLSSRERYLQLVKTYFHDPEPFIPSVVEFKLNVLEQARLQNIPILKKPCMMICFGSKWKNKQIKEETLVLLLDKIEKAFQPFYLFIFGNEEERLEAERLYHRFASCARMVGELSLPLWQAVMGKVDLVFSMDSAALHLAATTKTPSFSLFGPSQAAMYKPLGEQHGYLQGSCPYGRTFSSRCPVLRTCPTGACIRDLDADALFSQLSSFWTLLDREGLSL